MWECTKSKPWYWSITEVQAEKKLSILHAWSRKQFCKTMGWSWKSKPIWFNTIHKEKEMNAQEFWNSFETYKDLLMDIDSAEKGEAEALLQRLDNDLK